MFKPAMQQCASLLVLTAGTAHWAWYETQHPNGSNHLLRLIYSTALDVHTLTINSGSTSIAQLLSFQVLKKHCVNWSFSRTHLAVSITAACHTAAACRRTCQATLARQQQQRVRNCCSSCSVCRFLA